MEIVVLGALALEWLVKSWVCLGLGSGEDGLGATKADTSVALDCVAIVSSVASIMAVFASFTVKAAFVSVELHLLLLFGFFFVVLLCLFVSVLFELMLLLQVENLDDLVGTLLVFTLRDFVVKFECFILFLDCE